MEPLFCAWWNLENLFDIENSPNRSDKLQRAIGKDLIGWNEEILELKLKQLAKIINKMSDNKGPDIIGVAEVENKAVLEKLSKKLVRTNYDIVHADSSDERGIDVAFIYDASIFEAKEVFNHFIQKRTATRDIVQVSMKYKKNGKIIVFVGNHWPSRTAGTYESEPYRMIAGETLAYFHERIYDRLGKDTPVIAMGDFNDNPYNRAVCEYALSVSSKEKVINAREKPYFYNLMWKHLADGLGTYYYNGFDMLDQFFVSGNIVKKSTFIECDEKSCEIIRFPEMTDNGKPDGKPVRFGKPKDKNGVNKNGYSDHFPIFCRISIGQ